MGDIPPMLPPIADEDAPPDVAAVYADIRATRGTDFINDFWRVLAHDPALLKRTWEDVKAVMAPGALDPLVKELIYVAVSVTNGCTYCINSHAAAARAKGMTDAMLMELIGVVGMANETNRLVTALQIPVDEPFLAARRAADAASDGEPPAKGKAKVSRARKTSAAGDGTTRSTRKDGKDAAKAAPAGRDGRGRPAAGKGATSEAAGSTGKATARKTPAGARASPRGNGADVNGHDAASERPSRRRRSRSHEA